MRGSVNYQINQIFKQSGIFQPGTSRHDAKQDASKQVEKQTPSNISQHTGIYSYNYANDAKDTWHNLGHFVKSEHGIKDMTKINQNHVQSYMEKRLGEVTTYKTWAKEAAHINKMQAALKSYDGQERNFSDGVNKVRDIAKDKLLRDNPEKGYQNPQNVINNLSGDHNLIARLQYEGGCRRDEATRMQSSQLKGITTDKATGLSRGKITLTDTKGGKIRDIHVSHKTYQELEKRLEQGPIKVKGGTYGTKVAQAARQAGENVTGTHDFRYNYTSERYNECISKGGMTHEQAMQQTSWNIGHNRANMTMHYLR